ncbi:hypothetical protein T439DRAFT_328426 [Meredithblackwellia eburnea MCA 4105]
MVSEKVSDVLVWGSVGFILFFCWIFPIIWHYYKKWKGHPIPGETRRNRPAPIRRASSSRNRDSRNNTAVPYTSLQAIDKAQSSTTDARSIASTSSDVLPPYSAQAPEYQLLPDGALDH